MNAADRELAGLVGRAWEQQGTDQGRAAVDAICDWWDARHVRWLEVLEQQRAERRLAFLAELDELERDIQARMRRAA